MGHAISIPVGIVVAREATDNAWQPIRWRAVSVLLQPPAGPVWRELRRGDTYVHYLATGLEIELHRKEVTSYLVNLANGVPSVYVVLRDDPQSSKPEPVTVHLATASPFEVQAYGESGIEMVDRVEMPATLVQLVEAFIAEHHVEEPFVKRQRQRYDAVEEHKFGQEPIHVLRQRRAGGKASDERG